MKWLFKSKQEKEFTVTWKPTGELIQVSPKQTILEALKDADIDIKYNCQVGSCKSCQCRVITGNTKSLVDLSYLYTREEVMQGTILACQSLLVNNVVVEPIASNSDALYNGILVGIDQKSPNIFGVDIRVDKELLYTRGQYALLSSSENTRIKRPYSFSFQDKVFSNDHKQILSFDVAVYKNGKLSKWVSNHKNIGKSILLYGPYGQFILREQDYTRPIIAVAGGSGFGVLLHMLALYLQKENSEICTLLHRVKTCKDLYNMDEVTELKYMYPNKFRFIALTSEDYKRSQAQEIIKHAVQTSVRCSGDSNTNSCEKPLALLCGSPEFVNTYKMCLSQCGLEDEDILSDGFQRYDS